MVYLQLNKHLYITDKAKIAFILSYLTDKEALKWREMYLCSIVNQDREFEYPEYKEFLKTFCLYFKPINQAIEANNKLITLKNKGKEPLMSTEAVHGQSKPDLLLPCDNQTTWASPQPRASSQEACQPRGTKTTATSIQISPGDANRRSIG